MNYRSGKLKKKNVWKFILMFFNLLFLASSNFKINEIAYQDLKISMVNIMNDFLLNSAYFGEHE